jgi:hypothetical protein
MATLELGVWLHGRAMLSMPEGSGAIPSNKKLKP